MAVIKLKIDVTNLTNVLTLFDTIRVWRSEVDETGPFTLITGDAATAAEITGTEDAPFNLNGLTLKVRVDGASEQEVTFATVNPVYIDSVVDEINDQTGGLVASSSGSKLVLTSNTTGTSSLLEITGGTGLTELGLTVGEVEGLDAHITLAGGQTRYEYDDQNGDAAYWYKTQYYNTGSGGISGLSTAVQGSVGSVLSSSSLITGQIRLANLSGQPYADQKIAFYHVLEPPILVETYGILGRTVEVTTNSAGYAEVQLVKGAVVDVTLVDTGLVRRITVPSTGTEFDVLGAVAAADDLFQLQVPTIPAAVRRS
jgi:hypothetical protein